MTRLKRIIEQVENEIPPVEINIKDFVKYLNYHDYYLNRCNGSHYIFKDKLGNILTIPVHSNSVKKVYIKQAVEAIKEKNEQSTRL